MELLDFIRSNKNWESILTESPYYITIKHDTPYIMLSYNQIKSDFNIPMVRECRGIILDVETLKPVCVPFYKFGNYGEGYASELDWNSVQVQEKIDGSLIKVWFDKGSWHISSNGTIDAKKAEIQNDVSPYKNFYELFMAACNNAYLDFNNLDTGYTYMFELTSPYNRVVIPYHDIAIHHIGTRNNTTFEEVDMDIGVIKPKHYNLHSLDECIESTKAMPYDEEGYVAVDKYYNRNKIKSPAWVAVHHMLNGVVTKERIVELIRTNEGEEFLNYFPEYKAMYEEVSKKITECATKAKTLYTLIKSTSAFESKKAFAMCVKDYKIASILFALYDGKVSTADEWLWKQNNDKIVRMIYEL